MSEGGHVLQGTDSRVEGAASSTRPAFAHVPALDGLRGLAVVAVILFHFGYLRGGWLGVDLFFVLSGYLITSLLLFEHRDHGRIDLVAFWGRRARRLLPALMLLLVAVAIYARFELAPVDLGRVRTDGLATLAFAANWHDVWTHTSYWNQTLAPSLLAHTWSLAVEEQLYVLWPILLTVALGRRRRRAPDLVARVALGVAAASAALAIGLHLAGASNERIYFGTDTRAVAVALGAFVAGWRRRKGGVSAQTARSLELVGLAAGALLAVDWWRMDGNAAITYEGDLLSATLLGAIVVAAAADHRSTLLAKGLGWKPLCWLGTISYGLYLWHWPIYEVVTERRVHVHGPLLLAVRLAVTLALALASWVLVERPIRARRPATWWIRWRGASVAVAATLVVVAALLVSTRGAVHYDTGDLASGVVRSDQALPGAPTVVIVGDSVAPTVAAPPIADPAAFGVNVVRTTVLGCQAVWDGVHRSRGLAGDVGTPGPCPGDVASVVGRERPAAVLIDYGGWTDAAFEIGGHWRTACDPSYRALLQKRFAAVVDDARTTGAPVVVAGAARSSNTYRSAKNWEHTACTNAVMRAVATHTSGVSYLDVDAWLCPGGHCREREDGVFLRSDGVHFQGPGGVSVAHWFLGQVTRLAHVLPIATAGDQTNTAVVRVCRAFAQLQQVSAIGSGHDIDWARIRREVVSAFDEIDPASLGLLPPDLRVQIEPLATVDVRSELLALIDRARAGQRVTGADLDPTTAKVVSTAFDAMRHAC